MLRIIRLDHLLVGQSVGWTVCAYFWTQKLRDTSLHCREMDNTHTHNRFTAGLEYVRVHPGQQVPER